MAGRQQNRPNWIRSSGIGVEFAASVAGFTLVGYWIDRHYGSRWGVLIGAVLGLTGGMYNLIRQSLAATREATKNMQGERESKESPIDGDEDR